MKLSRASHSVIGGNKQIAINQDQWPGEAAEKLPPRTDELSIATGPKMYTPARNQPHFGLFFWIAAPMNPADTSPITEIKFNTTIFGEDL